MTDIAVPDTRVLRTPTGGRGGLNAVREAITKTTGLTTSGIVLVFMTVGFWFLGWLIGGRPLYLIAYLLALVLVVSYLLGRRPLNLEGRRSDARPRFAEGETIDMEVALNATRRLSTFILEEQVPAGLGDTPRIAVPAIDGGQEVTHAYKLSCSRRGVYSLGPLVVKWGDPFGLTQRQTVLAEPTEMLVHPGVELVQDRPLTRLFEDPPIRPPVSKPWPQGLEFYGMRAYTPGDDIRRVVWRAYARTGQLLVRESEQGITDKITIILDQDIARHSKGDVSDSFEAAVKAAASLGVRHLREGYQVTLEGNANRILPPVRGGNAQMRYLDALARVERVRETLVDPIMRLVSDPSRDTHVVVITPHLHAEAASRLNFLLQRGASVLVAAVIWEDEGEDTLGAAASLGCQVVELRPNVPLAVSFRRETGAGVR
ncbi:MAG TPA: DUF58 domain-containing protein [Acidimicrobiales bacterium]|nr:DUF58 domain-containing protein [Acidimicrobiales bacterium]